MAQLFDDAGSLAKGVAAFLCEGWRQGETLLVVARPENWALIARRLAAEEVPVEEASASGRLVVLDAAQTLASFARNGRPIARRFDEQVGSLVRRLVERSGQRLRIYGEMVELLAAKGDLASAHELERHWNALAGRCAFTLLCGYSSGSFGDARTAGKLLEICAQHHHVSAATDDLLGSWLLAGRQAGVPSGAR